MLKPYFVELKITAVVMAESMMDAMGVAEAEAQDIARDGELTAEDAIAVKSLEHLQRLDSSWDADCLPYNGDGARTLRHLLPEEDPFEDAQTADMFAPNAKVSGAGTASAGSIDLTPCGACGAVHPAGKNTLCVL